mmetsp:Transcript_3937/g.9499  ORF Transcript_3937/g.9499 Transcript_3937/m.9499 type:complete len:103 (-) Transcript_3937:344-652(-)
MTFATSRIMKAMWTHASGRRFVGMPSIPTMQNAVSAWNQESAIDFLSNDDCVRSDLTYSLSMASSSPDEELSAGVQSSCLKGHVLLNEQQRKQLAISKDQLL